MTQYCHSALVAFRDTHDVIYFENMRMDYLSMGHCSGLAVLIGTNKWWFGECVPLLGFVWKRRKSALSIRVVNCPRQISNERVNS